MRRVEERDFDILFEWINEEEVVKNSRYKKRKSLEEFTSWFYENKENKDVHMFILERNNKYLGQINIRIYKDEAIINYSVDKDFRGKGIGKELVAFIEIFIKNNLQSISRVSAYISKANIASIKVFESREFVCEIDDEYFVKLIKNINTIILCEFENTF